MESHVTKNEANIEFIKGVLSIPKNEEYIESIIFKFFRKLGVEGNVGLQPIKDTHTIQELNVTFELPIIYNCELINNFIDVYFDYVMDTYSYSPDKKETVIEKLEIDIKINDRHTSYVLTIRTKIGLLKADYLKEVYSNENRLHLY